jgi:hypothetical protein
VPPPPLEEIVTPKVEALKWVGSHVVPQRSVSDPTDTSSVAVQLSAAGGVSGTTVPTTPPLRRSCAPKEPGVSWPARASTLTPLMVASSGIAKPKLERVIVALGVVGVVAQKPSVIPFANWGLVHVAPPTVPANRGPSESATARLTPKPL